MKNTESRRSVWNTAPEAGRIRKANEKFLTRNRWRFEKMNEIRWHYYLVQASKGI